MPKNVDEAGQRARLQLFADQQRALLAERRAEYEAMGTVPEPAQVGSASLPRPVLPIPNPRDWRTMPPPRVTLREPLPVVHEGHLFLAFIWIGALLILLTLTGSW